MHTRLELEEHLCLLMVYGSHAYGLNTVDSDVDMKGLVIGSKQFYLGFNKQPYYLEERNQQWNILEPCKYDYITNSDTKVYELSKFIRLCLDNNPNCLDLLYSDSYLILNNNIKPFIDNRHKFLSKRVYTSYSEYAKDEIRKCKTHRGYLQSKAGAYDKQPLLSDYDLPSLSDNVLTRHYNIFVEVLYTLLKDSKHRYLDKHPELNYIFETVDYKGLILDSWIPPELVDIIGWTTSADKDYMLFLSNIKRYNNAVRDFNSYHNWKKHRNSKRGILEAKTGYDCKHLTQAIRLLIMCEEILLGKGVLVDRKIAGDADYLLNIKLGNVSFDEVLYASLELQSKCKLALANTTLSDKPDVEFIENLLVSTIESSW